MTNNTREIQGMEIRNERWAAIIPIERWQLKPGEDPDRSSYDLALEKVTNLAGPLLEHGFTLDEGTRLHPTQVGDLTFVHNNDHEGLGRPEYDVVAVYRFVATPPVAEAK